VLLVTTGAGVVWFMNRTPPQLKAPNYFAVYKTQDTVPVGKTAVFISGLIMPEHFRMEDFYNLAMKPRQYVPWPIVYRTYADKGVVLLDPDRFYEFKPFTPSRLVDIYGNDADVDGVAYVDKFHRGEIRWIPPSPRLHMDHGYFLYEGRKGGLPTPAAKLINKARVYYYGIGKGFTDGRVPHEAGEWAIASAAMDQIKQKYGDIPFRFVSAETPGRARAMMRELLDGGAETILLAPPRPIYSHHEEFNGSIKFAMDYIHEWEADHGKKIKVIITPQLGEFPIMREAFLNMLRDRLNTLPEGITVKVVVSTHGMAWSLTPKEAWIELAPPYRDAMVEDVKNMLGDFNFDKVEVVHAQDHFGDSTADPGNEYLSTSEAFWDGIRADYDVIINLPIEFFSENTDTMFSHAMFNFDGFPGYDIYQPVDYPDWSAPYTRSFNVEGTAVIYNGLPVGRYNTPIVAAYVQAISSVLDKRRP